MRQNFISLLSLSLLFACSSPRNDQLPKGQTNVENGIIEGTYNDSTGLEYYFGVPFAKPPVGELRWKAPQPLENWEGIKSTKEFGPRPMQNKLWDDLAYRSTSKSEDCLYLNIWAPAEKKDGGLPVLVYIHGGGLMAGDGSELRYDGESMAKKGMVVVTINYRLNVFGLLAHPELSAESPYGASGNYALLDQVAALEWVQRNIAAFGGNPQKVTIAGESAGSMSVSMHMASPLSKNLIAGAIGESGASIHPTGAPIALAEAEEVGKSFAEKIGAPSLEALRALPAEELFQFYNDSLNGRFPLVLDGHFLPKTLPEIFEAKEQAQVPLLLGWNSAELPGSITMQGKPFTPENFIEAIQASDPENSEEILKVYPHSTPDEVRQSATDLISDGWIVYSTWKWFDLHRKNSDQPVYRYLYSKHRPYLKSVADTLSANAPSTPPAFGAPHACEIEYCMGNLDLLDHYWAWSEEDYKVSETMQQYFANFILTGDPNGEGLPDWPVAKSDDSTPPVMILDVESKSVASDVEDRYVLLDRIYKTQ